MQFKNASILYDKYETSDFIYVLTGTPGRTARAAHATTPRVGESLVTMTQAPTWRDHAHSPTGGGRDADHVWTTLSCLILFARVHGGMGDHPPVSAHNVHLSGFASIKTNATRQRFRERFDHA